MKIAIIGTHFSGKTELVDELHRLLTRKGRKIAKVTEVVRKCPLPVNTMTTFDAQKWILAQQIREEIEASGRSEIVLSDRSVIDNYIYMMRGFPEQARAFLPLVLEHGRTYDYIFKTTPHETEIAADGFRDTDPVFRREIEDMLSAFLKEHGIKVHEIPQDNQAEFVINTVS